MTTTAQPTHGGQTNDTARLLTILHQVAEGAHASVDLDDQQRPHNLLDGALHIADHAGDDQSIHDALLYLAAQSVSWLLVLERRRAAQ